MKFFGAFLLILFGQGALALPDSLLEHHMTQLIPLISNGTMQTDTYDKESIAKPRALLIDAYASALNFGNCMDPTTILIKSEMSKRYRENLLNDATKDFLVFADEVATWDESMRNEIVRAKESFLKIINSEQNELIVYVGYNDNGVDSGWAESCSFYYYQIYRKSGKVLRVDFNYTD